MARDIDKHRLGLRGHHLLNLEGMEAALHLTIKIDMEIIIKDLEMEMEKIMTQVVLTLVG